MKTYEKPRLMALSLSGNDQLCGSCANAAAKKEVDPNLLYKDPTGYIAGDVDRAVGNGDGTLERSEAIGAFGASEDCDKPVDMYCKFASADMSFSVVAWS